MDRKKRTLKARDIPSGQEQSFRGSREVRNYLMVMESTLRAVPWVAGYWSEGVKLPVTKTPRYFTSETRARDESSSFKAKEVEGPQLLGFKGFSRKPLILRGPLRSMQMIPAGGLV